MTLTQFEPKSIKLWTTEIKKVYLGSTQVRPKPDYLCFTANTSGSTVKLRSSKSSSPVSTVETSTDWENWSTYNISGSSSAITLTNAGDKVYFRSSSATTTWFSQSTSNYIYFEISWSVACSWDLSYLINKNWTNTLPNTTYIFTYLFSGCSWLTSCPKITFTNTTNRCYSYMFWYCTWLTTLPKLYATTFNYNCCNSMFYWCSGITLSTTQTWAYQTPYRLPIEWTWTASSSFTDMFRSIWWPRAWTPSVNTTYYTSNTVV